MSIPMLKPKLHNWSSVPRGGEYRINLKEKGMVATGYNFDTLLENARSWRRANGFPVGLGFAQELECEVCRFFPQECEESDARYPSSRKLGLQDVIEGTKAMFRLGWEKIKSNDALVDQQEANRRAAICSSCPFNSEFAKPCTGICESLKEVIVGIVGGKSTSHDGQLRSCQICGCFLSAAVWVRLDIQQADLTHEQRQRFQYAKETAGCWKA